MLIVTVMFILGFVDATAMVEDLKRCAPTIWQLQWPKYTGCTIAAHESLAGGLIGAGGVIWAAWLAFDGIQEQLAEERERRRQQHIDAKKAAIVCIEPSILAAAAALYTINKILAAERNGTPLNEKTADIVRKAIKHVDEMLSSFTVRDCVQDLSANDRVHYLTIVGHRSVLLASTARQSRSTEVSFLHNAPH